MAAPPPPSASAAPPRLAFGCALAALVLLAYGPALGGALLWDDAGHVTRPELRSLAGLARIWFEPGATQQYYPLLHSAFWLEHRLWGDATLGYHLVNALLHATSAWLFAAVLRRLAVPGATLAALLFALHPVGVESVAWISEQKNTLSLVFALAATLAWLRFESARTPARHAVATAWFACALLTKSVTATLPGALLVLAWWQRRRIDARRDVLALAPWFAAAVVAGFVTAAFERTQIGAHGAEFALGALDRVVLAGRVAWFYAGKLLWPAALSFVYPRWEISAASAAQWIFPLAAVALLAWLVRGRHARPGLLAATLVFGGTLVPALGFVNVYPFVFSYVADHFQYHASLAVFALAGAALAALPPTPRRIVAVTAPLALGLMTWTHVPRYRSDRALFASTLAVNPHAWLAHQNLGAALVNAGQPADALPHLEATLRLRPNQAEGENNLGDALRQLGRLDEARTHLERALQLRPGYATAHNNLGAVCMAQDRRDDALAHFAAAVRAQPAFPEAELNWALALAFAQRLDEAGPHFERALRLRPAYPQAELMYGRVLAMGGRFADAAVHLERAVALEPSSAEAHYQFAAVLRQLGRMELADRHRAEAERLAPRR